MARGIHRLSAAEVRTKTEPGHYSDGGGLYLQVSRFDSTKSWVFKFTLNGRTRGMGIGPIHTLSLAEARAKAADLRKVVAEGKDPIEERNAARLKAAIDAANTISFNDAIDKYLAKKDGEFRNEKHRKQWRSTLDTYAAPVLGKMNVAHIAMPDVLRVLEPIWAEKTETASRLRGRIEAVLSWATVAGFRTGDNPARWTGNLKELLPKPSAVAAKDNQPALSLSDLPGWFAELRKREGMSARALEFLTLCASRSGEVRGATWDEFDMESGLWTIPANRMKAKREHRVPLTPDALALLKALPRVEGSPYVFPAARGGALSDMSLSAVMRRMQEAETAQDRKGWVDPRSGRPAVPHGLRSTFRDWAAETGVARDMAEIALAHTVGSEVERAYRRSDMLERRRALMVAWGAACRGERPNNVIAFREAV
ncbi:integrase [Chelatococcus caeni]|uniref:Integrase n=1 Tax=Chelatococcus caeni TaxID=1348468 RepID=A0A840C5A9_9HYPH|nr:site-specific integrase [Chelatococcus caeni]MBB4020023.1 integrase [Chelatococcus caeni]